MDTKDLILLRLSAAPERTMTATQMHVVIRYRLDGARVLRELVRDGLVERHKASMHGRRGRRPTLYTLLRKRARR